MLILFIKNSLTTDEECKLRAYKTSYAYNRQDDGSEMLSVIVRNLLPDTPDDCSGIKTNMETMKLSQFNHDTPRENLQIVEWMNGIFIAGETYS